MSNWSVPFTKTLRFESFQENFFDAQSEVYDCGRRLFLVEVYPNGQGIKLNANLFLR